MQNSEPLAPIDDATVAEFWTQFLSATGRSSDTPLLDAWQFGDSVELADQLLELVMTGPKRATAGTVADYEADDDPLPEVGDYSVLCDGAGQPRAVIETTDVRIGPLSSVDEQFAWDEGEGDRTRADWLRIHTDCFTRRHAEIGVEMHVDIAVVFERFAVVHPAIGT